MKKSVTPVGIVLCVIISLLLAWFCAAEPEFLAKLPILCAFVELLPFALAVFIARNALSSGIFCCAASAAAAVFSVYDRIFAGGTRSLFAPAVAVLASESISATKPLPNLFQEMIFPTFSRFPRQSFATARSAKSPPPR